MDENIGFSYENLSFNMNDRAWLKCPCEEKNKEKTCLSENQCVVMTLKFIRQILFKNKNKHWIADLNFSFGYWNKITGITRGCGCPLSQTGHSQLICGLSSAQIPPVKQALPSLSKAHMDLLSVYHLKDILPCTEQHRGM